MHLNTNTVIEIPRKLENVFFVCVGGDIDGFTFELAVSVLH